MEVSKFQPKPSSNRCSYHTNLKIAVQLDLVPAKIKSQIPKTTRHRFKHTDYSHYFGSEYDGFIKNIELVKELIKKDRLLKIARAYLRISHTIRDITLQLKSKTANLHIREQAIASIKKVKDVLGLERALYHFRMTKAKYYSWLQQIKNTCLDSPVGKCLSVWPKQLTKAETGKLKSLCNEKRFYS